VWVFGWGVGFGSGGSEVDRTVHPPQLFKAMFEALRRSAPALAMKPSNLTDPGAFLSTFR